MKCGLVGRRPKSTRPRLNKMAHTETQCDVEGKQTGRFTGMFHRVKFGLVARMSGWSQVVMRPVQILANVGHRKATFYELWYTWHRCPRKCETPTTEHVKNGDDDGDEDDPCNCHRCCCHRYVVTSSSASPSVDGVGSD